VPTAIKLQEQYGDDLQVIFVECQRTPRDGYEAFAWKQKWMGNRAMWTDERPIPTVGKGLPETALIGVDGRVVMQGYPGNFGSKLEEALEAEIAKSKEAPAGTPAELKKAWTSFLKGKVAAAFAECDKLTSDAAKAAREEFVRRTQRDLARAKRLVDQGSLVEAEELCGRLAKNVAGCAELEPLVAAEAARIAAPELAAEREAAKALAAHFSQVAKKKPFDDASVQKTEAIAKKHAGTKTAERAAHFAALAKRK
jgi:hypothetical protein